MPPIRRLVTLFALVSLILIAVSCGGPTTPSSRPSLLVITHTAGFRHASIGVAEATIAALGQANGFDVTFCRNADEVTRLVTAEALKKVSAVFFANTTGDLGLPDRDAFFAWVRAGGGVLGAHSATDTYHDEPRFIDMMGGEVDRHGAEASVDLLVEGGNHPAAAGLGERWRVFDEIYHFTENNRHRVTMLLSLDRAPDDGLPGAGLATDMPIAWAKTYGNGRVFYTALGHREDVWQSPLFQRHLLGAISWAIKR